MAGGGGNHQMDAASVAMYWMGMYALLERFLPPLLRDWLHLKINALWEWLLHHKAPDNVTLRIPERSEECINHVYRHSVLYISSLDNALGNHKSLDVVRPGEGAALRFHLPLGQILEDTFHGVVVKWKRMREDTNGSSSSGGGGGGTNLRGGGRTNGRGSDSEYFTLEFPESGRPAIVPGYLEHVTRTAMEIQHRNTQLKIYSNCGIHGFRHDRGHWDSAPFTHPSTFESIALDPELHTRILDDLEGFRENQELYRHLGRAWKRGYLLHGPPGTGKSSLIAAIANRLHYDIYDLELTSVADNAELKTLLMRTTRKSIIVIEDIDCSFQFADRGIPQQQVSSDPASDGPEPDANDDTKEGSTTSTSTSTSKSHGATDPASKLTLSGLLNFTDGLWSGCAEERIFIFTTNFKERLDPALLRPGRMDMHIHLSYCTPAVVEKLAHTYLDGASREAHPELFAELEEAARAVHTVTPAAAAELFIGHGHRGEGQGHDPEAALKAVIEAIRTSADALLKTGVGTNEWEVAYRKHEKKGTPRRIRHSFVMM